MMLFDAFSYSELVAVAVAELHLSVV